MKIFYGILAIGFIVACHPVDMPLTITGPDAIDCPFSFDHLDQCSYKTSGHEVTVQLKTSIIDDDELGLASLSITHNEKAFNLKMSAGTNLTQGDTGYISFADINFDSIPDLAVTTSFGDASAALDYWVYQPQQNRYLAVGNFPKLTLHPHNKTVSANAQQQVWAWKDNRLIVVDN